MRKKMRALRKVAPGEGNIEICELSSPEPIPGKVLIEVRYAGICGTDLHIEEGRFSAARPPVTLGHEFSGVVAGIGPDVEGWKIGDRVTAESAASFCNKCPDCLSGQTQRCPDRLAHGVAKDGGFADYVLVRNEALHSLPINITFEEGALTEPLSVAIHAVLECSAITSKDHVLITGPGTIGLIVLQIAKSIGCRVSISGTEKDKDRLRLAREFGANECKICEPVESESRSYKMLGDRPFDIAFECSGSIGGIKDCLKSVRKGGEMIQVGLLGKSIQLDYDTISLKEIALKGSFTHNHATWQKAIHFLRDRKVDLRPLITKTYPISQWAEAFDLFRKGAGLKYLLYPDHTTHHHE
jgi:L-iditol 2-dehydrogenase